MEETPPFACIVHAGLHRPGRFFFEKTAIPIGLVFLPLPQATIGNHAMDQGDQGDQGDTDSCPREFNWAWLREREIV
jgi:hypothetical protein